MIAGVVDNDLVRSEMAKADQRFGSIIYTRIFDLGNVQGFVEDIIIQSLTMVLEGTRSLVNIVTMPSNTSTSIRWNDSPGQKDLHGIL